MGSNELYNVLELLLTFRRMLFSQTCVELVVDNVDLWTVDVFGSCHVGQNLRVMFRYCTGGQ